MSELPASDATSSDATTTDAVVPADGDVVPHEVARQHRQAQPGARHVQARIR